MNSIGERVELIALKSGFSISALEREIGVSNGLFRKSVSANSAIGSDKLEKILTRFPEVNARWLLLGEGEMYQQGESYVYPTENSAPAASKVEEPASVYASDTECLRVEIAYLQRALQDKEEIITLLKQRQ